jgi:hypothetical protein
MNRGRRYAQKLETRNWRLDYILEPRSNLVSSI